jgi:cysteine desulfurase/selenocysteine lyase
MKALVSPDAFPTAQQYTYLNAASIALMPEIVAEAAVGWQRRFGMLGTVHLDEESEAKVFDTLRQAGAHLLGAQPEEIACASNASEILCSLAWALSPGPEENVVSAHVEFPSVVYPWLRVAQLTGCDVRLASERDHLVDPSELIELIDDRTCAVCISHVEYATGQRLNLSALAQVAHSHGAILIVDATQSAGAVPIDVMADDVDILVTSGYKWLCAPLGSAILFVRRDLHEKLQPGLVGWRSTEQVGLHFEADHIEWASSARRFEFGTIAYGLTIGLATAIEYLLDVGIDKIHSYNLALADRLVKGLADLGAHFISPSVDTPHSSIITVRFPGYDSAPIARRLNEEGVVVAPRIGGIRISPHLYNTAGDIDRALEILQGILEEIQA